MSHSLKTLKAFGAVQVGSVFTAGPSGVIGDLTDTSFTVDKGTVTQATSPTTAVTLNRSAGVITTLTFTTGAGATTSFTFNNSMISASSVVILTTSYSATIGTSGVPLVTINNVSNGSCTVNVSNIGDNALNGTLRIHFLVC